MAKKYYVVWAGHTPGVYQTWDECKRQVHGFAGARYKSFPTHIEAENAFKGSTSEIAPKKRGSTSAKGPKTYSAQEVLDHSAKIKIFSDGGCEPNPGKAGSGIAVYVDKKLKELWYGLFDKCGTNNSAELLALREAMLRSSGFPSQEQPVAIFSDSKYSIQCITEWAVKWKKNGWKKSGGEIKNLELIKECHSLYEELKGRVDILHVNGHVGVEGNELADRMTAYTIQKQETDFVQYPKPFKVDAILNMCAG